jgi:hypothetical protein
MKIPFTLSVGGGVVVIWVYSETSGRTALREGKRKTVLVVGGWEVLCRVVSIWGWLELF